MIWIIINFVFKIFGKIYFSREKKNWSKALEDSKSYQDNIIIDKVIKTYRNIKNLNLEFYERDGLLFEKKIDETNLLNFLNDHIDASKSLEVLDFGGSLGSRYFSNYNFLNKNNISWNIVEQKKFVDYGKKNLQKKNLQFYYSVDDCLKVKKIDCVVFSGSLQYLEKYFELLQYIKKYKIKSILFDFLPLSNFKNHRIFIQNIPKKIYKSSYPIRIFSKENFIKDLKDLEFQISLMAKEKTVFYGFNYHTVVIKDKLSD